MSVFFRAYNFGDGVADLFEAWEIPEIGKIAALLGLHGLDGAIVAGEKNAFAVRLVLERESLSIGAQAGEFLDEIEFGDALELREQGDFGVGQADLTGPSAAGGATLAFVKNRHVII